MNIGWKSSQGKWERIVWCRKKDGVYYVVTDRWQTFTRTAVNADTLDYLAAYSDELLVHGVDVEGRQQGIETELVSLLGSWGKCPVTYAGGISAMEDIAQLNVLGQGRLDFTVGSALEKPVGRARASKNAGCREKALTKNRQVLYYMFKVLCDFRQE